MDFLTNFMERLTKQSGSPATRTFNRLTRKIDRISVNNPETLGRYQVLPINSAVTEFPFISGRVRQISLPRRRMDESGEEQNYNAWIHIPSFEFFQMRDATDRVVSSLTAEDEKLLSSTYNLWEELYSEVDGKTNYPVVKDFIRAKNMTVFSAYCMNFWKYGSNNRTPDRQNFSALFMITTKNFIQSVEANINDKNLTEGGPDWIYNVYNNQLKNRDGFLMFSVNKDKTAKGFTASATHEFGRSSMLSGVEIPQEDFDAGMDDPVSLFLGWQANSAEREKPSGSRRLFNAALMKEACSYMGTLLSAIRAEKAKDPSTPIDVMSVVSKVVEDYYKNLPPLEPRQQGNGQGVAQEAPQTQSAPVNDSPTTHIDPLMGSQEPQSNGFGGGFGGFSTPSFGNGGFGGGTQSTGTPF